MYLNYRHGAVDIGPVETCWRQRFFSPSSGWFIESRHTSVALEKGCFLGVGREKREGSSEYDELTFESCMINPMINRCFFC